jgi:alpha-amylase/alpha-mannosidase (GH57 family)
MSRIPSIRLLFLWHMHQPYYKNLVTGEYRLPWVRLHALKDYYGMVKLLDGFPGMRQTFNLVPSLIAQIQDYVSGSAQDPFLDVVSRPPSDLTPGQREFALASLFQANMQNMIVRYPRYRELWEKFQSLSGVPAKAAPLLQDSEFGDLQVLSQIAWMDEIWLQEPSIAELVKKGRNFNREDQRLVVSRQKDFLAQVIPAYAAAQARGAIEISTSPYYHPILPLVCDTDAGAVSHAGLPLPNRRFRHPEDAREQIVRGLALHEQVFGAHPKGMWPSEGSVSNEVLGLAADNGIDWVATDEGVLGRSLGTLFQRDGGGTLVGAGAEKLYQIYRWRQGDKAVNMIFRDHSLSDLIGFVYSGVPAETAVEDFIRRIKLSCKPVVESGKTAIVPIILDGENAWEYYPESGREFLSRLYEAILKDDGLEPLTVSEAMTRETTPAELSSVVPGSWINANFDVWIGAQEDNLAWDYLADARDFFEENAAVAPPDRRELAFQELMIAEGSDWNWWYGPEHHSANDREFDELYRAHLSNIYYALGASAPDSLAQSIIGRSGKPQYTPQTAYISPRLDANGGGYFDWLGAATHVADRRSSAMHGKEFLLDTGHAGIDGSNLYCRLDFMEKSSEWAGEDTRLLVAVKVLRPAAGERNFRLEVSLGAGAIQDWSFSENGDASRKPEGVLAALRKETTFECGIPLALLGAELGTFLRIRFSLWRGQLPIDALPQEGLIEVQVVPEENLSAVAYAKA